MCAASDVCGEGSSGATCCPKGASACTSPSVTFYDCCQHGTSCCGYESNNPMCCPDSSVCCHASNVPACADPHTEICCTSDSDAWACPIGSVCLEYASCTTACMAHPGMTFLDGREALAPYSQPNEAACCLSCQVNVTGVGVPLVGATLDLVTRMCTCWQSGTLHPIPDHREFVVALVPQPQGGNKHAQTHKNEDRARPLP